MNFQTDQEIKFFINLFETWRLPAKDWTHPAHLVVGTYYVHAYHFDDALIRIRKNIKAYNIANGGENSDTAGYHETITVFYLQQVQEILKELPPQSSLVAKTEAVLQSNLMNPKYIFNFYKKELLMSSFARLNYIKPDNAAGNLS